MVAKKNIYIANCIEAGERFTTTFQTVETDKATLLKIGHDGTLEEIEPNTFVPQSGPEHGMPHHRFNADELKDIFEAFEVTDVHIDNKEHLCLVGYKL